MRALLHSGYDQPDAAAVHAQLDRVLDAITDKLPHVAAHLETARADVLAFTTFPKQIWRQIWGSPDVSVGCDHAVRPGSGGHRPPRVRSAIAMSDSGLSP